MARKTIKQSKKAIFLIIGLIHLDVFLIISGVWPALPIGLFVNALIIILSLYLTGQSAIDVTDSLKTAKPPKDL